MPPLDPALLATLKAARDSRYLQAPYNFVPLNQTILAAPAAPDHAVPRADHLCGKLTVRWHAETPLLVGGHDNNQPFRLGATYAIPGASLRGMLRAVLEIASFARLAFFDDRYFALRDFQHVTWAANAPPPGTVHAGWLQRTDDGVTLTPCKHTRIEVAELCAALGCTSDAWYRLTIRERHALLGRHKLEGEIELSRLAPKRAGRGTLVVASASPHDDDGQRIDTKKHTEAVFLAPDDQDLDEGRVQPHPIGAETWRAFELSQHRESERRAAAEINSVWGFWEPELDARRRVPVFFQGDAKRALDRAGRPAPAREFSLSLSRFFRIPYARSVRAVARSTQADIDRRELDFCEALFGIVPAEDPKQRGATGPAEAWRGRVFVRHAVLVTPQAELDDRGCVRHGVTMQPRASFYPFYLRPKPNPDGAAAGVRHPVDYANPHAQLAGRKRYPARGAASDQLPQPPPGSDPARLANTLRFLRHGSPGRALVFAGPIRFHNLHPVELGGLLWALGFGAREIGAGPHRHLLGRAKAFGYGQMRAELDPAATTIARNDGQPAPAAAALIESFEAWVIDRLAAAGAAPPGAFAALEPIATLRALADPAIGAEMAAAGLLAFPRVAKGANEAERTVKAYQAIKKRTGQKPKQGGLAGEAISRDPGADAFQFLPDYPRR